MQRRRHTAPGAWQRLGKINTAMEEGILKMGIVIFSISAGALATVGFTVFVWWHEKKDPCDGCGGNEWGYCYDGYYGECRFLKGKKK